MKKLKKALSLSLAFALSLSLAVPVSAADDFGPYSVDGVDSTWSFSSAKVETRDIKLEEEGEFYPNKTFILVQPNSTITYSGYIGSIELYTKIGDYYSALGESRNLSQSEPDMTDTINVNDFFSGEVDLGQIILWTSDSFEEIFIILDDGSTTEPEQPTQPTNPTEPEQPTEPTTPTQPTTPVATGDGNYKVHTTAGKGLNVRTGPGTEYKKACPALREGTVVEVVELQGQWGKLANDAGWVFMPGLDKTAAAPAQPEKPAEPEQTLPVTMRVDNVKGALNVRTGPGTNYKMAGPSLKNGTTIEVVELQGQWGKLANDAGWVYLPGAKTVKG